MPKATHPQSVSDSSFDDAAAAPTTAAPVGLTVVVTVIVAETGPVSVEVVAVP